MADNAWTPWKMTAVALALVIATAIVSGLVVAYWPGREPQQNTEAPAEVSKPAPALAAGTWPANRTEARVTTPVAPPQQVTGAQPVPAVPTQAAINACNQYAATHVGQRDKSVETVKDAAIGALLGAAVGAAGGAIADGGKGAGEGAGIGGGG